jgi:hypothetical protein
MLKMICSPHGEDQLEGSGPAVPAGGDGSAVVIVVRNVAKAQVSCPKCGKKCAAHTVKTSWKDLGLLFLLVGMGMLVFGSLEYYIENEEDDTGFTSIPQVHHG